MPRRLFATLVVLGLSACASAHGPELSLSGLDHLKRHATETVDINFGPLRLALAGWILGKQEDPDSVALRNTLKGCKAVHIRVYQFASDFEYPQADIDAVRSQLSDPAWSPLVTVRDRKARENVDVYIRLEHEKVTGFVVLASEPREFTIVNIVGSVDVADIQKMSTQFAGHARRKSMPDDAPPDL